MKINEIDRFSTRRNIFKIPLIILYFEYNALLLLYNLYEYTLAYIYNTYSTI